VTNIPLGIKLGREEKPTSATTKNNFLIANEKYIKDKNGVRREILPYHLDEVAYHILK